MSIAKRSAITGKPVRKRIPLPAGGVRIETLIPWAVVKRGARCEVTTPIGAPGVFHEEARQAKSRQEQHSPLLRSIGLAHHWQLLLGDGRCWSITDIATTEGLDVGRVSRILRLAQIALSIVTNICDRDRSPCALEAAHQTAFHSDWEQQEKISQESMRTQLFECL